MEYQYVSMAKNDGGYERGDIARIVNIQENVLQYDGEVIPVIWTLEFPDGDRYHAEPYECDDLHPDWVKVNADGSWGKTAPEIPVSWFTADELLQYEWVTNMTPADLARVAWESERRAYQHGEIEMDSDNPDFDWCSRYEALKAARLYEAAERLIRPD